MQIVSCIFRKLITTRTHSATMFHSLLPVAIHPPPVPACRFVSRLSHSVWIQSATTIHLEHLNYLPLVCRVKDRQADTLVKVLFFCRVTFNQVVVKVPNCSSRWVMKSCLYLEQSKVQRWRALTHPGPFPFTLTSELFFVVVFVFKNM